MIHIEAFMVIIHFPMCFFSSPFIAQTGARAVYGGFANGVGEIWLDTVRCRGTESSLALCTHDGFGNNNCGHLEDAGVSCPPPISKSLRNCLQKMKRKKI